MILTSTEAQIPGYATTAYRGIVQGETLDELLHQAETAGANAVLNTCFDAALDVDTLFHGFAVVLKRVHPPRPPLRRSERRNSMAPSRRGDQ